MQYFPGDWVEVGRQQAETWLATGQAERPDMPDMQYLLGVGVVALGQPEKAQKILPGLEVVEADEPALLFEKTLIWNPKAKFQTDFIADGFGLLDTWEVAIPIVSYKKLARDIGTQEERDETERVIRDLRVPFYSPDVLFLRDCRNSQELLRVWDKEGGDTRLALLRALYQVKPLILALPVHWLG
ncbi:MAG: hypothetical protein KDJ65_30745 [Anaerolineae bacterium]|nr:hypothetical protein [Anaerolineae bacterium]